MSNLRSFHVHIRTDEAGYFVARCVELPAAMTQGKTEEEAIENIKKAIRLVLKATQPDASKKPVNELAVSEMKLVAYA